MGAKGRSRAHEYDAGRIGQMVVELRRMIGLTQLELGILSGIRRKRIGYIERGERPIRLDEFVSILWAFHDQYPDGLDELLIRLPLGLKRFITDGLERFNDA